LQTTREGSIKGKIAYMAPEQLAVGEVTRAADVYAMGVVLWEMLTGKRLFRGQTHAQLAVQVMAGVNDPPSRHAPHLPPDLDALVMTAIASQPSGRFSSAREMAEALLRIVPPAFPTEVGKWVEAAAKEGLARRELELAGIEASSEKEGPTTKARRWLGVRRDRGPSSARTGFIDDDVHMRTSQSSALSIDTPRHSVSESPRSRRAILAGAIAVALVGAASLATFRWGASSSSAARSEPPSASVSPPAVPVAASVAPSPPAASVVEIAPASPPAASVVEIAPPHPPIAEPTAPAARPAAARPRPKARPLVKPTAPFRFALPD
jgi:serine/threonine-protein kinase